MSAQQLKKRAGMHSKVLFELLKCKVFLPYGITTLHYPKSLIWDKQTLIK